MGNKKKQLGLAATNLAAGGHPAIRSSDAGKPNRLTRHLGSLHFSD